MPDPDASHRPRLLFLSHGIPGPTGAGLSMRAWATAWALSETWAVTLLVVDHQTTPLKLVARELEERCERVVIVPKTATAKELRAEVSGQEYDVVHVFRAAARRSLDIIAPVLAGSPRFWLDLDDVESRTYARMAGIADASEVASRDRHYTRRVQPAERAEREIVSHFDRVFVCSKDDLGNLPGGRATIDILPNIVFPPDRTAPPRDEDPFTLLMIGSWSYYPNDDGLGWLLREIWPRARALSPRPLQLLVAGRGQPTAAARASVANDPDVEWQGFVRDLDGLYARTDLALVPIRAGGGTRIKAIEALAHRRPVVGTTIGLEGLGLVHGEHASFADDPWAFAEAIVAVATDAALREHLAASGHQHWQQRFTIDAIVPILAPGSVATG